MMEEDLHEQDRNHIIDRLKSAGWKMAAGAERLGRAALEYDNGQMLLEVEQDFERRELTFSLTSPSGEGLTVYPVYGDALEPTLDALTGFQTRITPENFRITLIELVEACPEVYMQDGEDGELRLLSVE
ncbi:hypothetical protein MHW47_25365 [Streptomyces sp. OfavH-34-F]|uniref:hypothetical protein n=1 Tax=Streptomyces sp. OfavH-34-F TaxID=2917760 RepID=UPI001EF37350|nr:hypothetical protein [Streptomyces sp. OfavH-34-F]MCG7527755.1 hypothetical protein [Streptomyces sp. OfavH-34-F]